MASMPTVIEFALQPLLPYPSPAQSLLTALGFDMGKQDGDHRVIVDGDTVIIEWEQFVDEPGQPVKVRPMRTILTHKPTGEPVELDDPMPDADDLVDRNPH